MQVLKQNMGRIDLEGLTDAEKIEWYRTASPEDIDKHNLVFMLKQFIGIAEELCDKRLLFFRLYRRIVKTELGAASVYVEEAKSKGYSVLPEFKKWIDRYDTLCKSNNVSFK